MAQLSVASAIITQNRSQPYLSRDRTQQGFKLSALSWLIHQKRLEKNVETKLAGSHRAWSIVWIKNIIRGDIWAGSSITRNLGHRLNLWKTKSFLTSKFGWLCVLFFFWNNRAKGGIKILLQFAMLAAEREREIKDTEQRGREVGREKIRSCVPLAVRQQPVQHFVACSHSLLG